MEINTFIIRLQRDYNQTLGILADYTYLDGTAVGPVCPVETARQGIVIVGAYPTAVFQTLEGERDVPVADIAKPFDVVTKSGRELQTLYLDRLGITRSICWITNLVKTFLFKPGHIEKYRRLKAHHIPPDYHTSYDKLAGSRANLGWLSEELVIAEPRLVITLGAAVAGILQNATPANLDALLTGKLNELTISGECYRVIHFAHPGIIMRRAQEKNPWPKRHTNQHIPEARNVIRKLFPEFFP